MGGLFPNKRQAFLLELEIGFFVFILTRTTGLILFIPGGDNRGTYFAKIDLPD
jgi:hypothetical protein